MKYCINPYQKHRLPSIEVAIGKVRLGANHPVLVQSMTTADTLDTEATVDECIRILDAGAALVRLTAPSKKEAEHLAIIKKALLARGYDQPLVADIHFTPNAAEIAALHIEKVRVNPGNYADKKKFEEITYTEDSYQVELERIEEKFTPLVLLCKKLKRAMRIGTNHGSLSDRILSRYGDTPEGMVASAYEFIAICEKHQYDQLVISMKASNAIVMVNAYRLLTAEMLKRGKIYPLHLGVTEAGEGEDGRIKSAVGIGALLVDGIGDTIRVSLTEAPEFEVPVAQKLLELTTPKNVFPVAYQGDGLSFDPFVFSRRKTSSVSIVGGGQVPVVISDYSQRIPITEAQLFSSGYIYSKTLDKWTILDAAADFIYIGEQELSFELPGTLRVLVDLNAWKNKYSEKTGFFPLVPIDERHNVSQEQAVFCLVTAEWVTKAIPLLSDNDVIVLETSYDNHTQLFRWAFQQLKERQKNNPIILRVSSNEASTEGFQLDMGVRAGAILIDGLGDGLWLEGLHQSPKTIHDTSFGVLQAARLRISKTEYISCPSCGRTLFDLQETTAKIRAKTAHLRGLKIGIMGCIVNGPGEMADADYGYVGSGPGKITLYKEKTVVRKNVPTEEAVDALISLIQEHGDWIDPAL